MKSLLLTIAVLMPMVPASASLNDLRMDLVSKKKDETPAVFVPRDDHPPAPKGRGGNRG